MNDGIIFKQTVKKPKKNNKQIKLKKKISNTSMAWTTTNALIRMVKYYMCTLPIFHNTYLIFAKSNSKQRHAQHCTSNILYNIVCNINTFYKKMLGLKIVHSNRLQIHLTPEIMLLWYLNPQWCITNCANILLCFYFHCVSCCSHCVAICDISLVWRSRQRVVWTKKQPETKNPTVLLKHVVENRS